jgi:hypothetical protein
MCWVFFSRFLLFVGFVFTSSRSQAELTLCLIDRLVDLALVWRARSGNPYVAPDGGLRSYRASVVTLQIDPTRRDSDERVVIGVINVMSTEPMSSSTDDNNNNNDNDNDKNDKVLKQLTRMLERQLRSTWDGVGRLRAAKARAVVSELTERVLVDNHGSRTGSGEDLSERHAGLAVDSIRQVLSRASAVGVVDMRGIVARVSMGSQGGREVDDSDVENHGST